MFLVFDTETTGLPKRHGAPHTDVDNWPRCVQLAWQLHDENGHLISASDFLIFPEGFNIPFEAQQVHGISDALARQSGQPIADVLAKFNDALAQAKFVVGHNVEFDLKIIGCEFFRFEVETSLHNKKIIDTCTENTATMCMLPGGRGGKFKLPTLGELHRHLFQENFAEAHNAAADVDATARCFLELIRKGSFGQTDEVLNDDFYARFRAMNPSVLPASGRVYPNLRALSAELNPVDQEVIELKPVVSELQLKDVAFSHLHNHTQFSILQSTTRIRNLVKTAGEMGCPAVALTDSGNMMAAFHFVADVKDYNQKLSEASRAAFEKGETYSLQPLKAIVGCEFNVCQNRFNKNEKDNGFKIVLLAKNKAGYHNLAKMASVAYTEGFYYVPRIDRSVVEQYRNDIICLSGNLFGEIPSLILNSGDQKAEQALLWWKSQFGEDFYLEMSRHGLASENVVNQKLLEFSKAHGVKIVATNDTYYLTQKEANAHDILLCVKEGELKSTPVGKGRGFRYGFENDQYYFKSPDEMKALFADLPEAIVTNQEIVAKCEDFDLAREILLPAFDIPEAFKVTDGSGHRTGENNYLRHLTYIGAEKRYGTITDELRERIDFELETIANTGYPGYFLIVQDLCQAARELGVSVGPGRGSAAGSVVAYATRITNVDPIKYQLLFERFLNPERVSMPDIDIDFDDEGRQKVIDWVINKYGSNQVAQIVTYGTMAAKSAIRDTSRVLDLPLHEADRLAKLIPGTLSLNKIFNLGNQQLAEILNNNQEDIDKVKELREIEKSSDLSGEVVRQAILVEGSMRNTGIHACGVIITPGDITNYVPVALAKDSDLVCTQFDNSVAEAAGLLKMDFLGLRTLTQIKDAVNLIRNLRGVELDPDVFPLDDAKTYELFQRGETVGIFQYESNGMQKYLRDLKPTVFGDLIALNALFRPGPLEYIPAYIRRKNKLENIQYDIEETREFLEETYGVTVYQEQVMLLSQKLAGFTKGQADTLRKAMGKKNIALMAKMKELFVEQSVSRNYDRVKIEKLWSDWEAFAQYAFNKSHSTCYAWIAYQTAYLKANYPAEYMAAVLSSNIGNIKEVSVLMDECRRMGIKVLGPDVNESSFLFTVNKAGAIRFGLGAIKGVGYKPAESIIAERENGGPFISVFDMVSRVDLRACNKRVLESLVLAGGLDAFPGITRTQYFVEDSTGKAFVESVLKYGSRVQEGRASMQTSLFGEETASASMTVPVPPVAAEWPTLERLKREKEVAGMFISGHPLDDYKLEIQSFTVGTVSALNDLEKYANRELKIAGIISDAQHRTSRHGKRFGSFEIEDYTDTARLFVFGDDYMKFKHLLEPGVFVFFTGRPAKRRFDDAFEFRIGNMELLAEIRDKLARTLSLDVAASALTTERVEKLYGILKEHKGKCQLKVVIRDEETGATVKMPSRTMKVAVDDDALKKIQELEVFQFQLGQT